MKKFILFLATAVAMVGCSDAIEETTPSVEVEGTKVSVNLSLNDASTRVDLADDGAKGYSTTWTEGDEVGAWTKGSSDYGYFYMQENGLSNDKKSAKFEGLFNEITPANDTEVRFIYPYDENTVITDDKYTISVAEQLAYSDMSGLQLTTHMISDEIAFGDISVSAPAMRHLGAAMDLRLKFSTDRTEELTLSQVVISGMPSSADVDLTASVDGEYLLNVKYGDIVIANEVTADASGIYTIPFNIIPFTLESGKSIEVVATFTDADANEIIAKKTISTSSAVEFARAKRHTLNALVAEEVVVPGDGTIEHPYSYAEVLNMTLDTENAETSVWVKGVIRGCAMYQGGIGLTDIYIVSNIVLGSESGDDIIAVELKKNTDVRTDLNLVDNVDMLGEVVFVRGDLIDYFGAPGVKNTDAYMLADENGNPIKPVAEITGLSNDEFTFVADGGTQYTYLNGENLAYGSYKHNYTGSQFTIEFEGKKVIVIANTNTTDADITETVTISTADDSSSVVLTLTQKAPIVVEDGKVMTLTHTALNLLGTHYTGTKQGSGDASAVTFTYNDMYTYNDNISPNMGGGYFYTNTEFVGLSKIVVTYSGSSTAKVTVGSELIPSTAVAPTEDDNVYTYDVTDGSTFFKITNDYESSYVNIVSVDVYYKELGDTIIPTEFTGLNPAALSFESDATEAQKVTIEGTNIKGAKSIAVDCESDYFTVDYITGATTFTVTPKEPNDTEAAYTATVKVNVDGTEKELTVKQATSQTSETLVTTLTKDGFNLGVYSSVDLTLDGITYGRSDLGWYSGAGAGIMQFKSESGLLYNKTAIDGLSKIVITKKPSKDNNLTVYVGTSNKPTSGAVTPTISGDVYTYEITTPECSYVHFDNGRGASYIKSIEIYAVK